MSFERNARLEKMLCVATASVVLFATAGSLWAQDNPDAAVPAAPVVAPAPVVTPPVATPPAPTPPAGGSYLVDPVTGVLTLVACTQPATVL